MHCIAGWSNFTKIGIGNASAGKMEKVEKAGLKAVCLQNIENRQTNEIEEEK